MSNGIRERSIVHWLFLAGFAVVIALLLLAPTAAAVDVPPTISTDKTDYAPGETVLISGAGFTIGPPNNYVQVSITRPPDANGYVETDVCGLSDPLLGRFLDPCPVTGDFLLRYQLDGILGVYTISAWDGTHDPVTATFTDKDNPAANIDQCENGGTFSGKPVINPCNWVNGDLNDQNSHFTEGQSVPYRVVMTNLPLETTLTITIGYDVRSDRVNALDYITSFQRITEAVNPCAGVSPCDLGNTFAIPAPNFIVASGQGPGLPPVDQPITSFNALPEADKLMTIYNGQITDVEYVLQGSLTDASSETQVKITFTASSSKAVLAWGGHIASLLDWGPNNSASTIDGSPYHSRVVTLCTPDKDGNLVCAGGSQDKSLKTNAVKATPLISTTIRDSAGNDVTSGTVTPATLIHDTATLTGATSQAGGTVTYTLYNYPSVPCSGTGIVVVLPKNPETVSVTNGVVSDSTATTLPPGFYGFIAVYSGDADNVGATSACEPLTVAQFPPSSLTTIVFDADTEAAWSGSETLGASAYDTASLASVPGITPTGTVTYTAWFAGTSQPANDEAYCTGEQFFTGSVSFDSDGNIPASLPTDPLAAGYYGFKASWPGDTNYAGTTSGCEPFSVDKAQLSITTGIHDADHNSVGGSTHVPLGSVVHDTATVTGGVSGFDLPAITFTFGASCPGAAIDTSVSLDVGGLTRSVDTSALGAGDYCFQATIAGDDNYLGATSAEEPFVVDQASTSIETTLHDALDDSEISVGGHVTLGTSVYDTATVTGDPEPFTLGGTVTFNFFKNSDCSGTPYDTETRSIGVASSAQGPLKAGSYAFQATYNGDSNYKASDPSACENFVVDQAQVTISTEIMKNGVVVNGGDLPTVNIDTAVYDTAKIDGQVSGFPAGGKVTYKFFLGASCSGPLATALFNPPYGTEQVTVSGGLVPNSKTTSPLPAGTYSFRAIYEGDGNYFGATSGCEPLLVVPESAVTNSALCTFDVDGSMAGSQFRLIFTQDPYGPSTYQLTASNPGQFYYNVFYVDATAGHSVTFMLKIPYPFVTQGATPIHAYDGVTTVSSNGQTCYIPGTEIFNDRTQITLGSFKDGFATVEFTIPADAVPDTGIVYLNIHLDYGLKTTVGWSKYAAPSSHCPVGNPLDVDDAKDGNGALICNFATYAFSVSAVDGSGTQTDSQAVQSENVFKKNPGVAGLVLDASGTPIEGVKVQVCIGSTCFDAGKTDEHGFYMWSYKYSGKPTTITVKLQILDSHGNLLESSETSFIFKSNGFAAVTFHLPSDDGTVPLDVDVQAKWL